VLITVLCGSVRASLVKIFSGSSPQARIISFKSSTLLTLVFGRMLVHDQAENRLHVQKSNLGLTHQKNDEKLIDPQRSGEELVAHLSHYGSFLSHNFFCTRDRLSFTFRVHLNVRTNVGR